MTSKSNESTLEDGSDDRRHRLNPQSTEGANGSIGPPGEGSSRGAEEAAHPLPLQLSGAPGAGPGSRQDAAFLPLSPIQQEPDSASPPLSVGSASPPADGARGEHARPAGPTPPGRIGGTVSHSTLLEIPPWPQVARASTSPPMRRARSHAGRPSGRRLQDVVLDAPAPTSPLPDFAGPMSRGASTASSLPSSGTPPIARGLSSRKRSVDGSSHNLELQLVLQRRVSNRSGDSSPGCGTPRSPVTLLPHSPVLQTPHSPAPAGGEVICGVPELPPYYVERPAELSKLRWHLLLGKDTCITGPKGTGGIGKTTIATAIARDAEVQAMYRGGIFWVVLSPSVSPMIKAEELKAAMAANRLDLPAWVPLDETRTVGSMRVWLRQASANKRSLLVVDNCTSPDELSVFCGCGLTLLVTTDNPWLPSKADLEEFCVPQATDDLAYRILASSSGRSCAELKQAAASLMRSCHGLPMALSLIGGTIKSRSPDTWGDVVSEFQPSSVSLEDLYGPAASLMDQPIVQLVGILAATVELLPQDLRLHYRKLAVLPDCMNVPLKTLKLLWELSSDREALRVCRELSARGLLNITSPRDSGEHIAVHEVQLDFLRRCYHRQAGIWHGALVDAYSHGLDHVAYIADDGYIVNNIAHHLKVGAVGREEVLGRSCGLPCPRRRVRALQSGLWGVLRGPLRPQRACPGRRRRRRWCSSGRQFDAHRVWVPANVTAWSAVGHFKVRSFRWRVRRTRRAARGCTSGWHGRALGEAGERPVP